MTSFSAKLSQAALLVLLTHWSAGTLGAQVEGGPAIGSQAPRTVTTDLDGHQVDLGAWLGKRPALIEFWATWCESCRALMPSVESAYARFGDHVAFLGVNVALNDPAAGVRSWVAEHHPVYRVLYDSSAATIRAYDIQATSTVVIVGADGKVLYTGVGGSQDLTAVLTRLFPNVPSTRSN